MNMCSVRQRPMPSAPKLRARAASSGVSALARTRSRRMSSAQAVRRWKCSSKRGGTRAIAPAKTSPVVPSIVRRSPSLIVRPPMMTLRPCTSICMPSTPATQGLPMPRATTAACEVMPPWAVMTPWATITP